MSSAVRTISVGGEGVVALAPDLAFLVLGVETADENLAQAQRENAARMARVLDALRGAGIAGRDLSTSGFGVRQEYDHQRQRLTNHHVSNSVRATVRDLAALGRAIDAAIEAGANQVRNVAFDLSDKADAVRQAREAAVADARASAEQYARLAGMRLGPPLSIVEGDGADAAFRPEAPFMRMRAASIAPAATPIESGEGTVRLTVRIVYTIEPADGAEEGAGR